MISTASAILILVVVFVGCPLGHSIEPKTVLKSSNSQIVDYPVFPDDEAPKILGTPTLSIEWFWLGAKCESTTGEELLIVVSISNLGANLKIRSGNQDATVVSFNSQQYEYNSIDGTITVGKAYPYLVLSLKSPHTWNIYIDEFKTLQITQAYRGPPLWYSKTTLVEDMLRISSSSYHGGYDGPSRINGYYADATTAFNFSGYGIYEHTWTYGETGSWVGKNVVWMFFYDPMWYGVIDLAIDAETNEVVTKTGRLALEGDPSRVYRFDDFEWVDDEKLTPTATNIYGNYTDLQGNYVGSIDLSSKAYSNFDIWLITNFTGSLDTTAFNGVSWNEIHRPYGVYKFNASWNGLDYAIVSVSNSTLTNFNFNQSLKQISFYVQGSVATVGYCNISIPKMLLWAKSLSQWEVTIEGSPIRDLTITEDSTHTFLYFTYDHSTREVDIRAFNVIPEFSSALFLPVLMVAAMLAFVLAKKNPRREEA